MDFGKEIPEEKELDPEEVSNKIIQSGIAERMLNMLKKYKGRIDPEITYGIEDCNFIVETIGTGHIQITIEHPNLKESGDSMVHEGFGVREKGFGSSKEPLTEEQLNLIQEIIREQKENNEEKTE